MYHGHPTNIILYFMTQFDSGSIIRKSIYFVYIIYNTVHKKPDPSTDQALVNSSMAIMSTAVISHNMNLVYLNHISNCGIRASVLLVGNVTKKK
jgi:hypothetical protein